MTVSLLDDFANGNTTLVSTGTTGSQTSKRYFWDLRGRMVGYSANGDQDLADPGDATIAYDSDGVRVSESVQGGTSTVYLQDKLNPTGYSQVLEEKATAASTPSRTGCVRRVVTSGLRTARTHGRGHMSGSWRPRRAK